MFPPPFIPDDKEEEDEGNEEEEEEEMTTEEPQTTEETLTTVTSFSISAHVTYRRLYPTLPPLYTDDEDEEIKKPVIALPSASPVSLPPLSPSSPPQFDTKNDKEEKTHDSSWNYEHYEPELTEVTDVSEYGTVTETFSDDEDEAGGKLKDYPMDYLLDKIFNITKPYDEDDFEGYHDIFFGSKCEVVYVFFRKLIRLNCFNLFSEYNRWTQSTEDVKSKSETGIVIFLM